MKNKEILETFRLECQNVFGDAVSSSLYPQGKAPNLSTFSINKMDYGMFNVEEIELYEWDKDRYKAYIWLYRSPDNRKYNGQWQREVIAKVEEIAKRLKISFHLPSNCLLDD